MSGSDWFGPPQPTQVPVFGKSLGLFGLGRPTLWAPSSEPLAHGAQRPRNLRCIFIPK